MNKFKSNNQYKAGNSDPFSPSGSSQTNTYTGTTVNNGSGTTTTTTNSGSSSDEDVAVTQEKITNSNGGVENPPATSK